MQQEMRRQPDTRIIYVRLSIPVHLSEITDTLENSPNYRRVAYRIVAWVAPINTANIGSKQFFLSLAQPLKPSTLRLDAYLIHTCGRRIEEGEEEEGEEMVTKKKKSNFASIQESKLFLNDSKRHLEQSDDLWPRQRGNVYSIPRNFPSARFSSSNDRFRIMERKYPVAFPVKEKKKKRKKKCRGQRNQLWCCSLFGECAEIRRRTSRTRHPRGSRPHNHNAPFIYNDIRTN